ncbi:hypothetical protein EJB05_37257, partial [Eragrostis curvula]
RHLAGSEHEASKRAMNIQVCSFLYCDKLIIMVAAENMMLAFCDGVASMALHLSCLSLCHALVAMSHGNNICGRLYLKYLFMTIVLSNQIINECSLIHYKATQSLIVEIVSTLTLITCPSFGDLLSLTAAKPQGLYRLS